MKLLHPFELLLNPFFNHQISIVHNSCWVDIDNHKLLESFCLLRNNLLKPGYETGVGAKFNIFQLYTYFIIMGPVPCLLGSKMIAMGPFMFDLFISYKSKIFMGECIGPRVVFSPYNSKLSNYQVSKIN